MSVATITGKYLGSHPGLPNQVKNMKITASPEGVCVYDKNKLLKEFSWDEVIDFDNKEDVKTQSAQRITVTRMATLGVFSLAAPKKSGSVSGKTFDILKTTSGDLELYNSMAGGRSGSLSGNAAQLAIKKHENQSNAFRAIVKRSADGSNKKLVVDAADLLAKYAALKEKGILSQEEFDKKKKELLA